MSRPKKVTWWLGATALVALLGVAVLNARPAPVVEDLGLATGVEWVASTEVEKLSYLTGISNLMSVEYAWQNHLDDPPTWKQTIIQDMWTALEHVTLRQAVSMIDGYYKDHEDEMHKAVLDVIWVVMVAPNLPEERR